MKRFINDARDWVGRHGWWMTTAGFAIAVIQAGIQWGVDAVFEFGWVQWLMFGIVVVLMFIKEQQTRRLIGINRELTTRLLEAHQAGLAQVIRDLAAGTAADPAATRRELQRYLDLLGELGGQPRKQIDAILEKVETLLEHGR